MFDTTPTQALASALADHNDRIGTVLDAVDTDGYVSTRLLLDAESSIVPAVEYFLAIATRFEVTQ